MTDLIHIQSVVSPTSPRHLGQAHIAYFSGQGDSFSEANVSIEITDDGTIIPDMSFCVVGEYQYGANEMSRFNLLTELETLEIAFVDGKLYRPDLSLFLDALAILRYGPAPKPYKNIIGADPKVGEEIRNYIDAITHLLDTGEVTEGYEFLEFINHPHLRILWAIHKVQVNAHLIEVDPSNTYASTISGHRCAIDSDWVDDIESMDANVVNQDSENEVMLELPLNLICCTDNALGAEGIKYIGPINYGFVDGSWVWIYDGNMKTIMAGHPEIVIDSLEVWYPCEVEDEDYSEYIYQAVSKENISHDAPYFAMYKLDGYPFASIFKLTSSNGAVHYFIKDVSEIKLIAYYIANP